MSENGKLLPIYEQFFTWQGEGIHQGRSAYFIRTFGCPVHCPWCDSAGTWHPDFVPKTIEKIYPKDLVANAKKNKASIVVVTGGEPTIHNLNELCTLCSEANLPVHLETSGAFEIKGQFDWITLSPKEWKFPLQENIQFAHEIKLIVDSHTAIDQWLKRFPNIAQAQTVWLHPEWSKRNDAKILDMITQWVKDHGDPYRAGYQMHKLFFADNKDNNSKPNVPLGGDKNLGY
jgi:organic radical activating enzyme